MTSTPPSIPSPASEDGPIVPGPKRTNSVTESSRSGGTSMADNQNRKSIQFQIGQPESQPPSRPGSTVGSKNLQIETQDKDTKGAGRSLSPPPPKTYERGVSFDNFDNPDTPDLSLTLNYKHKGYQLTRRSRTFLCGTDMNDYSDFALEWLIDELMDDGDELVCLRVVEKDSSIASDAAVETGKYRKEAEKLFEQVIQKNSQNEKAISLVVELAVGKVQDIITRMIGIYEPAILVVGTRGKNLSGVQGLMPGSVSKWCLQRSPIPVIVVRPSPKREKKKKKRLADPTRRSYNHILELSEQRGSHIFSAPSSRNSSVSKLPDEEAAVAAALGLPQNYQNSRSSLSASDRSSVSHDGPLTPMAESLEAINNSLQRKLSISSDDTKGDEETLTTLPRESSSDEKLSKETTPSSSDAPSEQPTPDSETPDINIPVIVTDDAADTKETQSKRRSL
ncbi:hypothetical protein BDV18DRAFT_137253 [Aspergillus unguis]